MLALGFVLLLQAGYALQQGGAWQELERLTFWVLLFAAACTHAFPVVAPRHQAYHATQAFLLAAVLLLSWPLVAVLVVAIHVIEWLRRKRPWYIQAYNVASYLLSAAAAVAVFHRIGGTQPFVANNVAALVAAVLAAGAFLLVNHAATAIVLLLARGISIRQSGLFGAESLGTDAVLLLLGIPIATGWNLQPLSIFITTAPLLLVYRALRLPGLEASAHRDRISGAYNRRHFEEALALETRRSRALHRPTSVLLAAVDDVPGLARQHGDASIDFLVAGICERVAGAVRGFDVVARVGESTIAVLLPEVDQRSAFPIAEGVLAAVAATPFAVATAKEPVVASLSGVVATFDPVEAPSSAIRGLEMALERVRMAGQARLLALATLPTDPGPEASPPPASPAAAAPPLAERKPLEVPHYPAWALKALQVAVVVPAVSFTMLAFGLGNPITLSDALLVLVLIALCEALAFDLYDRSSFSINSAVILAATTMFGAQGVVIATWSAAILRGALRRSRWERVLFNGSVFTVGAIPGALIFGWLGAIPPRATQLDTLVVATLLATATYYTHTFLVASAIGLDVGVHIQDVWSRNFRWLFPHYVVLGLMGLGLAVGTVELGLLGGALFFAPPLMTRFVLKQYTERTSSAVKELMAANADLVTSSGLLRQRSEELALLSDLGRELAREPQVRSLLPWVAQRCVPVLGDGCALVWLDPAPAEIQIHSAAEHETLADYLRQMDPGEISALAERIQATALEGPWPAGAALPGLPLSHTSALQGSWLAAPLAGPTRRTGWLLAWSHQPQPPVEGTRRVLLAREVAQRLGAAIEHGVLVQEAAAVDALRIVSRAKTEFIATAAHELRTPVTSIQGFAELLQNPTVRPDLHTRWLGIVQEEAEQLGLLLDQLLDVSRLESARYRVQRGEVALQDLVPRIAAAFAGQAITTGHRLETAVPPSLPPVFADPVHVERVLRNLVSNALKYSPAGGSVRLSAALKAGQEVEISIQDEGLGIPREWIERLFERFQRIATPDRAAIRGSGLGLYIARQLVEMNEGRIWASSAGIGKGSTFHVALPVAVPGERLPLSSLRSDERVTPAAGT